jgi:spore cortex formation protein SpoVR/YcgB (stage V sporulation)
VEYLIKPWADRRRPGQGARSVTDVLNTFLSRGFYFPVARSLQERERESEREKERAKERERERKEKKEGKQETRKEKKKSSRVKSYDPLPPIPPKEPRLPGV